MSSLAEDILLGGYMEIEFEKVAPEEVGIDSLSVLDSIKRLNKHLVPMHSILLSRGNKLCLEAYYKPFASITPHRIYSCTKSFVSLAIGILMERGEISLSDRIVTYFPEKCPSSIPAELDALTIRDMLMMATCYTSTTYKAGGDSNYVPSYQKDWVGSFFNTEPNHMPGSIFMYDTSSTHVLSALVEKVSGKDLLSFLEENIFKPIGASGAKKIVKDPMGVSVGGSGLIMTPMDLLKTMRFVANGADGIIGKEYLKDATSKQIDTYMTASGFSLDTSFGYGYQIWMMRDDSYAFYGLGGQYAIYYPKKDMILVTTADTQGYPGFNNYILDELFAIAESAEDHPLKDNPEAFNALSDAVKNLKLSSLCSNSEISSIFRDARYKVEENKNGLEFVRVKMRDKTGVLTLSFGDVSYSIPFGVGRNIVIKSPFANGGHIASSASGSSYNLSIGVKLLGDEFGSLNISLADNNGEMTLYMKLVGELSITGFSGLYRGKRI